MKNVSENSSTDGADYHVNLKQSKLLNEVLLLLRISQRDSESFCSRPSMDIITLTIILLKTTIIRPQRGSCRPQAGSRSLTFSSGNWLSIANELLHFSSFHLGRCWNAQTTQSPFLLGGRGLPPHPRGSQFGLFVLSSRRV